AVLFFRRPQNREVDQIDRWVGFEKIAPGTLAGVRLARYEENAQLVAHTVDAHNDAVVDLSEFAGKRRCLDLDDILPAVRNWHGDALRSPDRNITCFDDVAVAPNGYLRGAFVCALVLDAICDRLRLADNPESRRRDQG